MTSPIDDLFRKILNDRRIFDYGRGHARRLLDCRQTAQLKKLLEQNQIELFQKGVEEAMESKRNLKARSTNKRERETEECIRLGGALLRALNDSLPLARRVFHLLDDFGSLMCSLPDMNDYGRVVEGEKKPIVEQFFLSHIDRASGRTKTALKRMFAYVQEGYEKGLRPDELGFVVRKVESLKHLTEVFLCQ